MATDLLVLEVEPQDIGDSLSETHWREVLEKVVKINFETDRGLFSSVGLITDEHTVSTTVGAVLNRNRARVKYYQDGGIETAGDVVKAEQKLSASIYPMYVPRVGKVELSREIQGDSLLVVNHCRKDWSVDRFSFRGSAKEKDLINFQINCPPNGIAGAPIFSSEQKLIGMIVGNIPHTRYFLAVPWGTFFANRVEIL
ncbi:MAG: hypothetical protein WCI52_02870 [bacterium]